ncbi:MAG: hypothetical protein KGR98_06400, partial [Verrucomicrobia bacterium]|nr:hypothetical protein [Verrucomicrobiota bacterium]
MKAAKTVPPRKTPALLAPVLLAILLIVLFWKSFVPAYVHFSNDGPLGQEMSHYLRLPAAMLGSWNDLNGIGMNASATAPDVSAFLHWALGPVSYSKFYAPISLFILGLGAWTFFRQLRLSRLAAILGSLAAVLGSAWFSTACWGDASQQIAAGMCFFALALVASNSSESSAIVRGLRLVLAGFAVGVNVMEAADIGAIYSLFVAAFIFVMAIVDNDAPAWLRAGRGIFRVVVIAVFAALIAAQSIFALIQFAIVGVVGMQGSGASKADQVAHWDYATQWSLPKVETLGIFVPGLFGYRMDTPENAPWLPDHSYDAGEYWGAVGRAPAWDRYFASGENGPPPSGGVAGLRFSGGGEYAGILVALIAIWAIAQSLRRQGSIFSLPHRRLIWFLTGVCICSILLAWGRFAPFYQIFYAVPYLGSEIRNPAKFINIFTFAFVTAFAVGVDGLDRRYLGVPAVNIKSTISRLQSWWTNVRGFDRKWTAGCGIALGVCVLGWFVYVAEKPALVAYLQTVGFSNDPRAGVPASQIAAFSISQAAWFLLFLAAAIFLFILIISGVFAGNRARLGGILLGGLLVIDLARGNAPWIVYWNYPLKYQSNPIVNFLRQKPWEHRVLNLPFASGPLPSTPEYENDPYWGQLYAIEWIQQLFPFYNIQSLDYVQNPRAATDL